MTTSPRRLAALFLALAAALLGGGPRASDGADAARVPAIGQVLRVSIGADRSVVTVATLGAPDAGEAVFWERAGTTSELVARTGEPVRAAGGPAFELRAIGRAWAAPGALLYLGTTVQGPPVLVRHDAAGGRLLAVGPDPGGALLDAGARPVVDASGCPLELEVFELLAAGAAPLESDGSVRFPAWLGPPCEEARARVRYRDGRYAVESLTVEPAHAPRTGAVLPWSDGAPRRAGRTGRLDLAGGEGPARP